MVALPGSEIPVVPACGGSSFRAFLEVDGLRGAVNVPAHR
jgi:hypothetical protein